jgi:hypothetical protein
MSFGQETLPKTSNVSWTISLKTRISALPTPTISLSLAVPQENDQYLRNFFTQLQNYGVLLNLSNCLFRFPEISFVGYKFSSMGSQPLPKRVADLQACPLHKTFG